MRATALCLFVCLAALDQDGDGRITPSDPAFNELPLWTDDNRDGRSQTDELRPLAAEGITRIDCAYMSALETDAFGNETRQRSLFFRGDSASVMIDAWFFVLMHHPCPAVTGAGA